MSTMTVTRPRSAPRTGRAPRTQPVATRRPQQGFQWDLRLDEAPADVLDIEESLVAKQESPADTYVLPHPQRQRRRPDPEAWAKALTRGIMEVISGARPLAQLRRWVVPQLFDRLQQFQLTSTGAIPRCVVRSAHSTMISSCTVELALVVAVDQRVIAVALRLEACRYHWIATALDIVF